MSLREIRFYVDFFPDTGAGDDPKVRERSELQVLVLLEALTLLDQLYLNEHPETPLLYDQYRQGKIKYKLPAQLDVDKTAFQGETFRDIPRIMENGGGDCDNIASWRVAELRQLGIAARPYITNRRDGDRTIYHVIVLWPDGSSEDPCLLIGMAPDRLTEIANEKDKMMARVFEARTGELQTAPSQQTMLGEAAAHRRNPLLQVMGWFAKARGGV